jgi:hypothetical protein
LRRPSVRGARLLPAGSKSPAYSGSSSGWLRRCSFPAAFPALVLGVSPSFNDHTITVSTGVGGTIPVIINNIIVIIHGLAFFVVVSVFLVGAFRMTASGGRESEITKGKTLMTSSLIGLAIITGSFMILSTFIRFLVG